MSTASFVATACAQLVPIALGVSVLLGGAVAAQRASRSPELRRRAAEAGVLASALTVVLLLLPLPWGPGLLPPAGGGGALWEAPPAAEAGSPAGGAAGAAAFGAAVLLACAAALAVRLLAGWLLLARLDARCRPAPRWLLDLAGELGLAHVELRVCPHSRRPFCHAARPGGRRRIVLPASLVEPRYRDPLRAVLLHEHAHLRLGHLRARLGLAFGALVLFWHPAFWWLARRHRLCVELLADAAAARRLGRRRYAAALLDLAELVRGESRWARRAPLALGALDEERSEEGGSLLAHRIASLCRSGGGDDPPTRRRLSLAAAALAPCALLVLFGTPTARAHRAAESSELPAQVYTRSRVADAAELGEVLMRLNDAGVGVERIHLGAPDASGQRELLVALDPHGDNAEGWPEMPAYAGWGCGGER
ncbi:MAG: M56 family metallopeptidase [Planctomycetota bacterium]